MNATMHPGQWVHHEHRHGVQVPKGQDRHLFRKDVLWIVAVLLLLFAVVTLLAMFSGPIFAPPVNVPYVSPFTY